MFHKGICFDTKAVTADGEIEGYGSVFGGQPDSYGDIIERGAFEESLAKHASAGTMPLMLWGHQSGEVPIGNWTEMKEDRKGLYVKGQVDLEDPLGNRVHRALKQKRTRGLSIGYETIASEADPKRDDVRHLTKIDLWEVSPVNFPAQPRAFVTGVKSTLEGGALPTLPDFEEFLREAGFSKSQATAIAGKGLSHLLRGEPGRTQAVDFLSTLQAQLRA